MITLKDFKIIGISVRTTNKDNTAEQDVGKLWGQFYATHLLEKIPNKLSNDIYAIYTDYKSDFTEEYTTIIGCRVAHLETIPNGCIGRIFPAETFTKYSVKGQMPKAIMEAWMDIWKNDKALNRKYTYDFELSGSEAQTEEKSEVAIYLSID